VDNGVASGSGASAGGGSCKLPRITVQPTSVDAGSEVKVTGSWFVDGCGGRPDLHPLTLIPVSFTDSTGVGVGLAPIAADGSDGTVDVQVPIPANVATGPGRLTVGQAAPAALEIKD
jgi:hypothetical protein